jgi:hypothetical protein
VIAICVAKPNMVVSCGGGAQKLIRFDDIRSLAVQKNALIL